MRVSFFANTVYFMNLTQKLITDDSPSKGLEQYIESRDIVYTNFCKQYNCEYSYAKGIYILTCREEDFLIIKLQCPEAAGEVVT